MLTDQMGALDDIAPLGDQGPGLGQQAPTPGGQQGGAACAFKQGHTQDLFQSPQLDGQGRLGNTQALGRLAQGSRVGNGHEIFQLS